MEIFVFIVLIALAGAILYILRTLLNSMGDSKDPFDATIKSISLVLFMGISMLIIYALLCVVMNEPSSEVGMLDTTYRHINLS